MLLQHRLDVILFIFRNVDGDALSGYVFRVFTDVLLAMISETLVNCFDVIRTLVLLSKLCIPAVRDQA